MHTWQYIKMAQSHAEKNTRSYAVSFSRLMLWNMTGDKGCRMRLTQTKHWLDERVREWNENCDKLLNADVGKGKMRRKHSCSRSITCSHQLDTEVFWCLEVGCTDSRVATNKDLIQKALMIAVGLRLQHVPTWMEENVGYRPGTNTPKKSARPPPGAA